MPTDTGSKLDNLLKLYKIELQEIMSDIESYKKFLSFSIPLYKYNFSDLVLIYASRPSATQCADFQTWTNRLGLNIRAGSKGIPIIEKTDYGNKVKYVFDVADVVANSNPIPSPWTLTGQVDEGTIAKLINSIYDYDELLNNKISSYCLTASYEDTAFLKDPIYQSFMKCIAKYIINSRCGVSTDNINFSQMPKLQDLSDMILFNNIPLLVAQEQLLIISKNIKNIRRFHHEHETRINSEPINDSRSSSSNGADRAEQSEARQVREALDKANEGSQPQESDRTGNEQQSLSISSGKRPRGSGTKTNSDRANDVEQNRTYRPLRKNTVAQSDNTISRRNSDSGATNSDDVEQFSLFSTATEKIKVFEEYENIDNSPLPIKVQEAVSILEDNISNKADEAVIKLNYKIPDDFSVPSGAKGKYQCNISAIKTLKLIESEGRLATPDEQAILAQYVGFGGIPQAFDEANNSWSKEYIELKELLTEDEYRCARASTLNAHYTSTNIIKAMYTVLENLGFSGGEILEPAVGIGKFFGMLPESMEKSKLFASELDSTTGRIACQLYQNADIQIKGFEECNYPINKFDVAISNVPFGDFNLSDDKYNMLIHDYFFMRSLDSVKTGGIVAFITSKGTLDKANPSTRKQLASKADLLGAIRLPNTAFKADAGTSVTSDIIFLQKRASPPTDEPDWVYLDYYKSDSNIKINNYFKDNPHMILGKMIYSSLYGRNNDTACVLDESFNLDEELNKAIQNIKGSINTKAQVTSTKNKNLPIDTSVKMFTYTVVKDKVYYNDSNCLKFIDVTGLKLEKLKAYDNLRHSVNDVINIQLSNHFTKSALELKQEALNSTYDNFVSKYGYINERSNQLLFSEDMDIALLSSIEDKTESEYIKGAIFTKATIKKKTTIISADTPMDALLISLSEKNKIDPVFMHSLCGVDVPQMMSELEGYVYIDPYCYSPDKPKYIIAEEYLSGDVKSKLTIAKQEMELYPDVFSINVKALEAVQPSWVSASDIGVRLSSHWISAEYVNQFIYQLLNTPEGEQKEKGIVAEYDSHEKEWFITNKTKHKNVLSTETYGTSRISAYEIIQQVLNQREVTIKDPERDGDSVKYVYNHDETVLARQRKDKINDAFKDWIFKEHERRTTLEQLYNDKFNCTVPRTYDGSYIHLENISPNINIRPHQLNGIARIRTGDNSLLAHVVGAGKTYMMIAGGMEQLRLGIRSKLLYVVPNHMTEQFGMDFLKLYPTANILVAKEKDFTKENRRRFVAKIATSDIDAVIIGHTQFEMIPISIKRKKEETQHEIDSLEHAIHSAEAQGQPRYSIKRLERAKIALYERMKKMLTHTVKDNVIEFEQLGVDSVFVDEAHYFKNGAIHSKMSNISGVSNSSSYKAGDMLAKTRYINEIGGTVTFATGTPISNSISEMYIMQRYLQEDTLRNVGIYHFDEWASDFGEITSSFELKPEGGGYRHKTRFSNFFNLPELITMFKEVADIQTDETLDLKKPKLSTGKAQVVVCNPSDKLLDFMDKCVIRAEKIRNGLVDSTDDNMLKMTTEARKAGTDMRLIDENIEPDLEGKIFRCADLIYEHYQNSHEFSGTQIVFCDISTPNKYKFNVYDELTRVLIEKGIPENEIARIHDADSKEQKEQLFSNIRSGKVRIMIGSTQKCGAGTNIQNKLLSLYHLDCPYRPSDIEQREGRILRPYNTNEEVNIYRFVTEKSFDSYLWQIVENKQRFISQIMTNKNVSRTCEEIDDVVLSFAEVKAIASGDPLVKERMELELNIDRLNILKSQYKKQHYYLQDKLHKEYPKQLEHVMSSIDNISKDLISLSPIVENEFSMEIQGHKFIERAKASEYLQSFISTHRPLEGKSILIGKYKGMDIGISLKFGGTREFQIQGNHTYYTSVGESLLGNIIKIENKVKDIPNILDNLKQQLKEIEDNIQQAENELKMPFAQEIELETKKQRLTEINTNISVDTGVISTVSTDNDMVSF